MYGAETETSSLVVLQCDLAPCGRDRGGAAGLRFLERRAASERRLRFRGWNASNSTDYSPLEMASPMVTDWRLFQATPDPAANQSTSESDTVTLAVAAGGGEALQTVVEPGASDPGPGLADPAAADMADALWNRTTALWTFDLQSVFSAVSVSESELAARFPAQRSYLTLSTLTSVAGILQPVAVTQSVNYTRSLTCAGADGCSLTRAPSTIDADPDAARMPAAWTADPSYLLGLKPISQQCVEIYGAQVRPPPRCGFQHLSNSHRTLYLRLTRSICLVHLLCSIILLYLVRRKRNAHGLQVQRATLNDRTGRAGPLVLLGPACRRKFNASTLLANDLDTPEDQVLLSLLAHSPPQDQAHSRMHTRDEPVLLSLCHLSSTLLRVKIRCT